MHRFRVAQATRFVALVAAALLAGCGGGSTGIGAAASVRFGSPDTLFLRQGASTQLDAAGLDASGRRVAQEPEYRLQSGRSVVVSPTGTLSAVGPGVATVLASVGGVSASRVVAVTGHPEGLVQRVSLFGGPYGVSVRGGTILVALKDVGSVAVLDTASGATRRTVAAGSVPTDVALHPNGVVGLVTNQHDFDVGLLDVNRSTLANRFRLSSNTFRVKISENGQYGLATELAGQLHIFDMTPPRLRSAVRIDASYPNALAFGPGDTLAYVAGPVISEVDVRTGRFRRSIPAEGAVQDAAVSRSGTEIWVAREDAPVVDVYSLQSGQRIARIPLGGTGGGAFGLAISPDDAHVYALTISGAEAVVLDRAARAVVRRHRMDFTPRRIAFDRFGTLAVASDEGGAVFMIR